LKKQVIYGKVPSKSNCYKIITVQGHGSLAKTGVLKKYENDFYIQCGQYRNKMIPSYFELHVDVYYPNQKSDLDNCLKVILDCLQSKVRAIKNDNKCVKIVARKFLDLKDPRIEFEIITI
jgi:Holliday junction resolvase RusA-like endonuclease